MHVLFEGHTIGSISVRLIRVYQINRVSKFQGVLPIFIPS
nr:MAG TPA: hypothetical protein [Caudoviricetes sp.]